MKGSRFIFRARLLALVLFFSRIVLGCTCNPLAPIEDISQLAEFEYIALVYVTDVQEGNYNGTGELQDKAKVTVEILTLFKGDSITTLTDLTRNTGCYHTILKGQEWIVFGLKKNNSIEIHSCDYNEIYRDINGDKNEYQSEKLETLMDLYNMTKNHPMDGVETKYYRNGNKELEIEYKRDKKQGLSKYWYSNGVLKKEITFINGKPNGWSKSYYKNCNLKYRSFNDSMGKTEGISQGFYNHGQLQSEIQYKNGVPYGVYRSYFDTILNSREIEWVMMKYFSDIDSSTHPWRNIQVNQEWVYDANGNRIIWREYYPNGEIKKEELWDYESDFKTLIYYHSNGRMSSIGYKKKGRNYGYYQSFNEDGTPSRGWDYDSFGKILTH
jgi:antitoxin component YwqK of YwqJK toxin-antitoxin module